MNLKIREEAAGDIEAIYEVTRSAFASRPYAAGDEQDLVNSLRDQGALSQSLVAEDDGVIVGQITFSPAQLADGSEPWVALGPVSVVPERQGEGIGALLIERGLEWARGQGALGCILTGNPAYYERFGFVLAPDNAAEEEPAEYFQLKLLADVQPVGRFSFHPAFYEGES